MDGRDGRELFGPPPRAVPRRQIRRRTGAAAALVLVTALGVRVAGLTAAGSAGGGEARSERRSMGTGIGAGTADPQRPRPQVNGGPDGSGTATSTLRGADADAVPTVEHDPSSFLVLVNGDHPLPDGWEPADLVAPSVPFIPAATGDERLLRAPVAAALESLAAAADAAGVPLAGVSGYRPAVRQEEYWLSAVRAYGEHEASRRVARPGRTEHQTGLAVDVTTADGRCPARECFGDTPAARWLADHAPAHGFVIRYPEGKEAVTGYQHEPWHLRFVGIDSAVFLARHGLVLEELAG